MTSPTANILKRAADIKAIAEQIDVSNTEQVTAADLNPGDIITSLGNVTFPFPFTLSKVQAVGGFGISLVATHGWFAPLVNGTDKATRVLVDEQG